MDLPPDDGQSRSFATKPRRRRRYSVWTLLAPVAVIVLWVSFFSALGGSCVFKECASEKAAEKDDDNDVDARNEVRQGGKAKVKPGDNLGTIAERFKLTEDELKACNPKVDPQTLQPNTYLFVSAVDCEEADTAAVGANPDPLAGDTAAGSAGAGSAGTGENGTAAADPSVDAAPPADEAAEQGDEG